MYGHPLLIAEHLKILSPPAGDNSTPPQGRPASRPAVNWTAQKRGSAPFLLTKNPNSDPVQTGSDRTPAD
jgi:hypothetical protein